jgi:hypothetical protein
MDALKSGELEEHLRSLWGPETHIREAVRTLDNIICRMEEHQSKKTPTLRPLSVASKALARKG